MDEPRQTTGKRKRAEGRLREHTRNRRAVCILLIVLGILVAFALGFLLRSQTDLMNSLGVPLASDAPTKAVTPNSTQLKTTYDALSARVGEVEDLLSGQSLDELSLNDATDTMLRDLMKSTGDPYAAYYDPERYEKYVKDAASKRYSGIGVLFADKDGLACAADVFPGSEAAAKGVQQGDYIVAIDGDSSHEWTMTEVVGAFTRKDGDDVIVTWMRPSTTDASKGREFTTNLECHKYEEANVASSMQEGKVGYVRLRQNTTDASNLVTNAVNALISEGATSFVLDIRDNPGGYLTQATDVASLFVSGGVLVQIETADGTSARSASGKTLTDAPMVVLINGYTGASAEVLAAALQDNNRATLVGERTMGKGSVQVVRELTFGGAVRYTAAYYLTPLGHAINNVGILPQITVANTLPSPEDEGAPEDTQLVVALDAARSLAGSKSEQ